MRWSWKIGQFRGIGVYLHATFLILIAFIVLSHWTEGHSVGKTLEGVGFILALFGCDLARVCEVVVDWGVAAAGVQGVDMCGQAVALGSQVTAHG